MNEYPNNSNQNQFPLELILPIVSQTLTDLAKETELILLYDDRQSDVQEVLLFLQDLHEQHDNGNNEMKRGEDQGGNRNEMKEINEEEQAKIQ